MNEREQEFQVFYERYLPLVYRYVYSKVGQREEAEDITSQVFMKAIKDIDYKRDQGSLQHWLLQVARTTIADYWRVRYRISLHSLEQLLDAGWEGPAEQQPALVSQDPLLRVHAILQVLSEQHREVLNCRFLLNLSIKETALRMGLTESNVKVLQFRALRRAADIESRSIGRHSEVHIQELGSVYE